MWESSASHLTGEKACGGTTNRGYLVVRYPRSGLLTSSRRLRISDELGDRATGGGDLLLGGTGDGIDRHLQRHGDLALAEDLDEAVLANGTLSHQTLDGDLATLGVERGQLVEVHDLVVRIEGVLEALQLREAHLAGHLPTLEALRNLVTGLRALGTTTGRLTLRRLTTTHTGLGGLGARGGTEVVDLERVVLRHDQSTSSTVTR